MQSGSGYYPRAKAPSGRYNNGNGGGFRYGQGQPYRWPAPPNKQQMTQQEREAVLMAAGRLAAEYLVDRGDLPPAVLENRPPAPIPFYGGPPAPRAPGPRYRPQQPRPWVFCQPGPRPFHFQGQQRPPAPQRQFPGPRPFHFQGGGPGPFPKRPHQRPFPYRPRGPAPVGTASKMQDNEPSAPGGEAGGSPPGGAAAASGATRQMNQPSSSSKGANDSTSKPEDVA
ncbi:hypothetical protein BS78_04G210400 [Paspalum vaginatum]|nr:hypothetical protein BS78_04G210400 [Paspalum vaginatum]